MEDNIKDLASSGTAALNAMKWVTSNPGMYEMMGQISDEEIAKKFNCKKNRVSRYRRALGIKFKRGRRPYSDEGETHGLVSSRLDFADIRTALDEASSAKREALSDKYSKKYPGIFEIIGKNPDQYVGDKYGLSRESVRLIRNKFNIQSSQDRIALDSLSSNCSLEIDKHTARHLLQLMKFISENMEAIIETAQQDDGEE